MFAYEKDMKRRQFLPFLLSTLIIALDQLTKALIVGSIPMNTIGSQYFGEFLRIIHVRNTAIAFSIGSGLSDGIRLVLFTALPLILLVVLAVYTLRSTMLTKLQRWLLAGIIGGGIGNSIDRIWRPEGVVDFIDVKFYGIFGLERWPTFNVADSTEVVCGILLLITILFEKGEHGE